MTHPLSDALARAVENAAPFVLRVEARHGRGGTGIAAGPDLVVSNARTIGRHDHADVGLPDGRTLSAKVVGVDPALDLALLRLPESPLPTPTWGDAATLKVGHLVLALGRPGRTVRAALGIVGGIGPAWRTGRGAEVSRFIDVDGSLPPGFPGGPLVDLDGHLVGINSRVLVSGGTTIPASDVVAAIERLAKHGTARRGTLGIAAHPVSLGEALAAKTQSASGLLVVSVEDGGPAAKGGVLLGDVLLAVNAVPVASLDDLLTLLRRVGPDAEVAVKLVRAGEVQEAKVTTG